MVPILGISLYMWVLILLKLRELYVARQGELPLDEAVEAALAGRLKAALWQEEILLGFLRGRTGRARPDRLLLDGLMARLQARMDRHIQTILVLAAVAPLLGLLGTVTGMIFTFEVITQFGTGNARALASGISEALITTQGGLMAAVPGLFMGDFLSRRAAKLGQRMNRFCLGLPRELDLKLAPGAQAYPSRMRAGRA